MLIYERLAAIQAELHAPKSQYNNFGGYAYRKAEDILEAVKPLLLAHGCLLNCSDELELIGERYYIKATACITCVADGSQVRVTAYAREEEEKKGMDGSQITGASSSYARKYALNGLLAIDDTADSDTTNVGDGTEKKAPAKPAKKAPAKPAAQAQAATQQEAPREKGYAPERGTENWNKWVKAIATGALTKAGKKVDWLEVFKANFHTNAEILDALDEDVFNARLASGTPANANA